MTFPDYPEFEHGMGSCATRMSVQSLGNIALEVSILLEDGAEAPTMRQLDVLESFNLLSQSKLNDEIAVAAHRYYQEINAEVDLVSEGIEIDLDHIDKHYRVIDITIPQHMDCDTDFVFLGMNCDWEEEHGMQIMLSDGLVVYCGEFVTIFYGIGWKRIISAATKVTRTDLLNQRLAEMTR